MNKKQLQEQKEPVKTTNPLLIVLFWLYVMIPLGWGVYDTLLKTVDLFR